MYDDLRGKVALVTGAGKKTGIGFAIAEQLAACGADVILADLARKGDQPGQVETGSLAQLEAIGAELSAAHQVRTLAVGVDVTDNNAIAAMVERVAETFARLDVLCNNAGASFGVPNAFHTYDEGDWLRTIDVNLHSVFRVTRAMLPLMRGGRASIVNTASRAGKVPPLFNGGLRRGQGGRDHAHQGHGSGAGRRGAAGQRRVSRADHDRPGTLALRSRSPVLQLHPGRP